MLSALDIAHFFIDLANHSVGENLVTNMRVNKLLYFAQGASYARFGKPLFEDDFEAWTWGPVIPNVYQAFKEFGQSPIRILPKKSPKLSRDMQLFLLDVLDYCDQFTTNELIRQTHEESSPWSSVYVDDAHPAMIAKEDIAQYFRGGPLLEEAVKPNQSKFIGYRDNDGYLVLPKELDE